MQNLTMGGNLIMFKTACASEKEAEEITNILIDEKLISSSHIYAARSTYRMATDDTVVKKDEWLVECISVQENLKQIRKILWKLHSYSVPEDIYHITTGDDKFEADVNKNCNIVAL